MLSFKGGIHPPQNKHYTKDLPVVRLDPPQLLYYPMSQHVGAHCTPCVRIGEQVMMGQMIGTSSERVFAPIHAGVSGAVVAIEPLLSPSGAVVDTVVVQNDGYERIYHGIRPNARRVDELTPAQIVDIVKNAGIVGMGGAGFPTHIKLAPPSDKKIDTILINGAECEPYITSDHHIMLAFPEQILFGLSALMRALGLPTGTIAIEDNKPDAIEKLATIAAKEYPQIKIVSLKAKYPQGSEKQIIKTVLSREVPPGKLPMDVGVVVNNIDTCMSTTRAILFGMPLTRRIVTVAGSAVARPGVFSVRLGTPISVLFEAAGGFCEEPHKIVSGGPMMGIPLFSLDVPVVKTTSALLAFGEAEARDYQEKPCIRCSKCVEVCPVGLMPLMLNQHALAREFDICHEYNLSSCIECGCCSYICPSRRMLLASIRMAKKCKVQSA